MPRAINQAYIEDRIGAAVVTSLTTSADAAITLTAFIDDATAYVNTALRNSGYATVATEDPDTEDPDDFIQLAVFGICIEMLYSHPIASLRMPENWDNSRYREAYEAILSGTAALAADPTISAAVGRWKASDATSGSADARPQRASRKSLRDW